MIPALQNIAHIRSRELVELFDLNHFRPDGQKFQTVFPEVGLAYTVASENIAGGQLNPAAVISTWKNSTGHNGNMLDAGVYHIGCGYALGGEWGRNWVQDFMTDGCATTGLRLEVPGSPLTAHAGTNIEGLGIKVVATCSRHGDSYMPLITEMCSVFDFSQPGPHNITVSFDGFSDLLVIGQGTPVSSVSLSAEVGQIFVQSGRAQISAQVLPESAQDKSLIWKSSNEAIAAVDENGLVSASYSAGEVTICATAQDGSGVSGSCVLTVIQPVETLTINPDSLVLHQNGTPGQLYANFGLKTPTIQTLSYVSSDTQVATVDSTGLVTPLLPGTATITATTQDGSGVTASSQVRVIIPMSEVSLGSQFIPLFVGSAGPRITPVYAPANATLPLFYWSSYDPNIFTVDQQGQLSPVSPGRSFLLVYTSDGSDLDAYVPVMVYLPATLLKLEQEQRELPVSNIDYGQVPIMEPAEGIYRILRWESSDESVATVGEHGEIRPLKSGTCTITASTIDGSGLTASMVLTVYTPPSGLSFAQETVTVAIGAAPVQYPVTIAPEGARSRALIWTSSSPEVATVDENGLITPVALGSTYIQVVSSDVGWLSAGFVVNVIAPQASPPPFLLGDANLDRIVDAQDAVALILYLIDGEVSLPCSPGQADMDGANGLNMRDPELLVDLLLR